MNVVKEKFRKILPLLSIFLIWFIFSSPYFILQKVPFPSSYLVNFFSPWNNYPGFSSPVKNNAMPDIITQIYPWKNLTIETFKNLQIPLWNPYSFSGTPHLANYQTAVLSPFNILFFVFRFVDAWTLLILLQPLLAGLFMYLCLRAFEVTKKSAVLGSVSFMFCGFITTWMAYGTLGYAILFLPLAIYAIEKYYKTGKNIFLVLLSFTFPLSFFSGHFQISLYFLLGVVLFIFYKYISKRKINTLAWTLIYSFLGILLSLPQLLPSIELYGQTLRSGIFEKLEAIPFRYLPTFIAPDFLGNPVTRNDWFGHYAEWNGYIGLIPLMLAIYGLISSKKTVWFFAFLALISLLFSFSSPFLDILIAVKIPVISTSAASRIIVLFSFSASVLAAFGFDAFSNDLSKNNVKKIILLISSFAVLFLFFWLIISLKLFIPFDKIAIAKQNFLLPTFLFLGLSGIVSAFLIVKKKIKNPKLIQLVFACIVLLVVLDMFRFVSKWMPQDEKKLVYPNVAVVSQFNKIKGPNRILGNLGGEATTFYNLPSVEGYDAVYVKRYGEFIASLGSGRLEESARSVVTFPKYGVHTKKAINLLNIKYIVHKVSDGHAVWAFPFWTYKNGAFSLLYNDGNFQILQNNASYERAFLVNTYKVENNPQKILNTMFSKDFNLRKEVVLEKKPNLKLGTSQGLAKILSYTPDKVIVQTNSSGNSLLFLSDSYYTGWEALVDGKKTEIYRADYTFRAVAVLKGEHIVEFVYNPLSFKLGVILGVFGLFLIIVLTLVRKKFILSPKT